MATIVASFFRHLSVNDIKDYLAHRSIDITGIDWKASDGKIRKSVIELINVLPGATRIVVFTDADAIVELADDAGHQAMLDATRHDPAVSDAFDRIDSGEGRALWLYVNRSAAFRRAGWARHYDQACKGRNWDGFVAPEGGKPDLSKEQLSALAKACADLQQERDGFRGAVEIEHFERLQSSHEEDGEGSITQVTIYTEDRPQSPMAFQEGELTRQRFQPANAMHITYCAVNGSIDVVAKGGRSMRKKAAAHFTCHLLGVDADPDDMALRDIDLSVLADRSALTRNVRGAIAEVDVKWVRFQPYDGESHYKIFGRRAHPIYDDLEGGRLEIPGYEIDRVELAFIFLPEAGRTRKKRVAVTLTAPNGCSVKDQGQLYRPAIEEFLERSGIYRAIGEDDEQTEAAE